MVSACLLGSRFAKRAVTMSDLLGLKDTKMARLEPCFPKTHGKPRVEDRCHLLVNASIDCEATGQRLHRLSRFGKQLVQGRLATWGLGYDAD